MTALPYASVLGNVFPETGAKTIAQDVLSGFLPSKTEAGISRNEINITGKEYEFLNQTTGIGLRTNGYYYTQYSLALAEISFAVKGTTYQKLLDGMAAKAGRGPSSSNPFPANVGQVDPSGTYQFQLGLAFQAFPASNYEWVTSWQGDLQVTDAITGQGSMGYEWNNIGRLRRSSARMQVKKALASATTGYGLLYNSNFYQPTINGTAAKVPQQPIAAAYVEYKIDAVINTNPWPAPAMYYNQQGYFKGGVFDPIPGGGTPFVPNSFGI